MQHSRIASFDPASTKNIGWSMAVVQWTNDEIEEIEFSAGTLVLSSVSEPWHALWPMFYFADHFLESEKPNLVVVEKTSSFSGSFVTGQVSNCMGCILAACGKHDVKVAFVYPSHVKKVITGKGRATKTEMKRSIEKILTKVTGEKPKLDSHHACDAVAGILTWLIDNKVLVI